MFLMYKKFCRDIIKKALNTAKTIKNSKILNNYFKITSVTF